MNLHFDIVVRLAWSNDPKSYASISVATGRVSHGRQVKGDDPDWGLGSRLTTAA
jgi:hypothetical protein